MTVKAALWAAAGVLLLVLTVLALLSAPGGFAALFRPLMQP